LCEKLLHGIVHEALVKIETSGLLYNLESLKEQIAKNTAAGTQSVADKHAREAGKEAKERTLFKQKAASYVTRWV
jgi:hypothetical protein